MRHMSAILKAGRDAFAGGAVGFGAGPSVCLLWGMAGEYAETVLGTSFCNWDYMCLGNPLAWILLGPVFGALGALSGTWRRGLLIGVILSGLLCGAFLACESKDGPCGVIVWVVSVMLITGAATGAMGGVVRQRRDKADIRMSPMGAILKIVLGAFAGAGVGLCVGIPWAQATPGYDMADVGILLSCILFGLLLGALGAFSRTWGRGLLIGVVLSGLYCGWWLTDVRSYMPHSEMVWFVTVWTIAGAASGAVGGVVRQRLDKKDQPAKA